jgi:hypothetical protein
MKWREWPALYWFFVRKENGSRLSIRRRLWQEIFDQVERKSSVREFHRTALWNLKYAIGFICELWYLVSLAGQACKVAARARNLRILQPLAFMLAPPDSYHCDLAILFRGGLSEPVQPDVLEMPGENLAAIRHSFCRNDQD